MWGHAFSCSCAICLSLERVLQIVAQGSKYPVFVERAGERFRLLEAELRDLLSSLDGSRGSGLTLPKASGPGFQPSVPVIPSWPVVGGVPIPRPVVAQGEPSAPSQPDTPGLSSKAKPLEKEGEKRIAVKEENEAPSGTGLGEVQNLDSPKREKGDKKEKRKSRSRKKEKRRKREESEKEGDRKTREGSKEKVSEKRGEEESPKSGKKRKSRWDSPVPAEAHPRKEAEKPPEPTEPPPWVQAERESRQGRGWRGDIPFSSHPRWDSSRSKNKGVVKRAKQEYYAREKDRWRRRGWLQDLRLQLQQAGEPPEGPEEEEAGAWELWEQRPERPELPGSGGRQLGLERQRRRRSWRTWPSRN